MMSKYVDEMPTEAPEVTTDGYPVTRCPADDYPITDPDEGCALCAASGGSEAL